MNITSKSIDGKSHQIIHHPKLGELDLGAIGATAARLLAPKFVAALLEKPNHQVIIPKTSDMINGQTIAVRTLVEPYMAARYLLHNPCNRIVKWSRVLPIIDQIKRDRWRSSNDLVCFDVNGNLINGQHRLCGIVCAGKAVHLMLMFGMSHDDMAHMDQNMARNAAAFLAMDGDMYPAQKQQVGSAITDAAGLPASNDTRITIARFLAEHVDAICAILPSRLRKKGLISALALLRQDDTVTVDNMCLELQTRDFSMEVMKKLYDEFAGVGGRALRTTLRDRMSLVYRVYECYREKRDLKLIRITDDVRQHVVYDCKALIKSVFEENGHAETRGTI